MSEELRPCPFCGGEAQVNTWTMHGITESRCFCSNSDCPNSVRTVAFEQWNTRPIEDALTARIAELEAGAISAGKQEVETKNRLLKERDKKIANLHKVITKQQLKIQRQAENITTLLHLYTSGKRSKSHKKLREKYRALKARMI